MNGIRSPFAVTAIGNAVINLGGGDDQIVVLGPAADAAATLSVETGTGNDQVLISDAATNAAVTLSNSGGTDVRRIQSSQVGSLTLGGPGSSLIQGSTVNGGLTSSSNGITNLVVTGSTVAGATNVSGSALNDNVIVSRSIFGGAFTVAGNAGNVTRHSGPQRWRYEIDFAVFLVDETARFKPPFGADPDANEFVLVRLPDGQCCDRRLHLRHAGKVLRHSQLAQIRRVKRIVRFWFRWRIAAGVLCGRILGRHCEFLSGI